MANKNDFETEEWNRILQGVMMPAMAITAADPSGLWGTLKEGFASAGVLAKAKASDDANELIKDIVEAFGTSEGRGVARDGMREKFSGSSSEDIKSKAIADLQEVVALIDAKAPGDAAAVKSWFLNISQSVAEASKEGGFLGFGGERISQAEQSALDEIARILK